MLQTHVVTILPVQTTEANSSVSSMR